MTNRHARRPARNASTIDRPHRDTATAAARDLGPCVYAVTIHDPDNGPLIKIGHTTDLNMRIHTLRSGWRDLLVAIPADIQYELALHRRFKPYRARGREYYSPVAEITNWVNRERHILGIGTP